jgi:hypothetical protein
MLINRIKKRNESNESIFDLEGTALGEFTFSTSWFRENVLAVVAGDDSLSMAEDYGCFVASSTFYIHKIGIG